MAKPYRLTTIELALSPMEQFEDNLGKFINDENIGIKNYFYFKIHYDEWTNINLIM
jgi:hypothetical protein